MRILLLAALLLSCGTKRIEGTEAGDCTDGADNDGDGDFDCSDDGCAGAPDCTGDADTSADTSADTAPYHPDGYDASDVHGLDAKLHAETCTDCHGAELNGEGAAVSCDTCHDAGWRTDCLFCHGGTDDTTGAPPEDLDDGTADAAFGAHSRHVQENTHAAFDCQTCHVTPDDVLSAGHLFDSTAGVAEVDFSGGLSADAVWDGKSGCSNTYCHSTGREGSSGEVSVSDAPLDCESCHAALDSSNDALSGMSGEHRHHISHNIGCHECHADTTSNDTSIDSPALHVNGTADIVLDHAPQISHDSKTVTCTGSCHGEGHNERPWYH